MPASAAATITTAALKPELFPAQLARVKSRAVILVSLVVFLLAGFGLRAYRLGAEGLSEDELNKVRAVEEYRTNGLSSVNGEHPFLMKALMTATIAGAERWNESLAASRPALYLSLESSARLPSAFFGALTALLIFLVVKELFGVETGLVAAALWAFDPAAVGFNRIAKEDTFLLFFFLLANLFWLRGQRAAEAGEAKPERYYWATAAAFGAMMASKYVPHYIAITGSYYYIFQGIPATRWRMGKRRWLTFFVVMGAAFLVCNPTILLPGTWHEMRIFAGEKRIGHDSYEFMGELYRNQLTLWLKGLPWYFYYVFIGVKLPLLTVAAFLVGLPLLFRRRLGDGRYFILFWAYYWFFPFTLMGGKFTRYFTFALPVVHIVAALGIIFITRKLAPLVEQFTKSVAACNYARVAVALVVIAFSAYASTSAAPYYRLYTNALGGGNEKAGSYFPHDEFYDAGMRETVAALIPHVRSGARVASETPELVKFYAARMGRGDVVAVSLSDAAAVRGCAEGDAVIVARGRRYFSNEQTVSRLASAQQPTMNVPLGEFRAAEIFILNPKGVEAIRFSTVE